ncbi:MAG: hypothetical protein HQL17_03345 [Candidatus Omnitrophica bacterium]|nr:hypothetical protein [Candidatus Omnitrophota bacterium]
MGRYLFENDRVHFWNADGQGVMPLDEFRASDMALDREAYILLAAEEGAVSFTRVREIKNIFGRGRIRTFVPYAQALRTFLTERRLMDFEHLYVVLDDLGGRLLLTVISSTQVLVTRVITHNEVDLVVDEIRRTQKNAAEHKGARPWRILSNNELLVKALPEDNAVFFETYLPAMQVLGRVKFPRCLMTPEEVAAGKRRERAIALAGAMAAALAVIAAGSGYYVHVRHRDHQTDRKLQELVRRRDEVSERLMHLAVMKYQDRLRGFPSIDLALGMDDLLKSLVSGMQAASVTFERRDDGRWRSSAVIFFVDGRVSPWAGLGLWSKAQAAPVLEQDHPGLRISTQE